MTSKLFAILLFFSALISPNAFSADSDLPAILVLEIVGVPLMVLKRKKVGLVC